MREKVTQVASLPYKSAYIQRWSAAFMDIRLCLTAQVFE